MQRLQKIIASAGICSRRAADAYIAQGRVTVNGKTAALGSVADPAVDVIALDGKPISAAESTQYIMLNKPRGYVTTMKDDKGRKTVADLVRDIPTRLYPAGRLDYDSEGLLIMTNDGAAAQRLTHPSHEIKKTYHVRVDGTVSENALTILRSPLDIDGTQIRPAKVKVLKVEEHDTLLSVYIGEGRNRQIRKMCEQANLKVTSLRRVAIGNLELGKLARGKWRKLSEKEIEYLQGL